VDLHRPARNAQRLAGVGFDLRVGSRRICGRFCCRHGLAAIDGAFVAGQTDCDATLERLLRPLIPSLVASRRALLAKAG
jgi:hypothetical protein